MHAALHRDEIFARTSASGCCIAMARLSLDGFRVCPRTKDVDLLILIGYNLSNWTGFEERSKHQKKRRRQHSSHNRNRAPGACGIAPRTPGMHETKSLTYEVRS
ncbi:hypothetical protein [Caballeronia sp. NK8]|uniref:hypothetical protein n=1 Tax=Caballeronia sp. NK8 TaxID=140098 RepID=UPI001BCC4B4B|nr:hypothetical protein [Caballeronia sp. NK8]